MVRAADARTSLDFPGGFLIAASDEGNAYGPSLWRFANTGNFTIDTTEVRFKLMMVAVTGDPQGVVAAGPARLP